VWWCNDLHRAMIYRNPLSVVLLGVVTSFTIVVLVHRAHSQSNAAWRPLSLHNGYNLTVHNSTVATTPRVAPAVIPSETAGVEALRVQPMICNGLTFVPTADNVFLRSAFCKVRRHSDIIQFSGPRISHVFDKDNKKLHVYVGNGVKTRYWGDVARTIIEVAHRQQQFAPNGTQPDASIQLHNYHKLGDFMLLFRDEYMRGGPERKSLASGGPNATPLTSAQFNWAIDKGQPPVVVTNWGDENWGAYSGRKLLVLRCAPIKCPSDHIWSAHYILQLSTHAQPSGST
jgi:hypothetical protein